MSTFDAFPDSGTIRFRRVRDFGEIVRAGFLVVRETFREFATGMLFVAGPVMLVSAIAQLLFQRDLFSEGPLVGDEAIFASGSLLTAQVFSLLANVFALAAGYAYLRLYRQGQAGQISPSALWEETKRLILPMLSVTLVVALAFVVLAVVVGGLAAGLAAVAAPLAVLAAIAAIAVAVWLAPAYLLIYPARAFGAEGAFQAGAVALNLLRARWGRAFGVGFVLVVLIFVLTSVLAVPMALVGGAGTLFNPEGPPGPALSALTIAASLANVVLMYPILAAVSAMLFSSLAEEQAGTGLMDDLEALAGAGREASPDRRADMLRVAEPRDAEPRSLEPHDAESRDAEPKEAPQAGGGFRGGGFGA